MKVTIDIDCTPEEARTFLGLPDVKPFQDAMMDKMQMKKMATGGFVKAADGVATKGKTKAKQISMPGNKGMKKGGKC